MIAVMTVAIAAAIIIPAYNSYQKMDTANTELEQYIINEKQRINNQPRND